METTIAFLLLAALGLGISSFFLGYDVAENRERKARAQERDLLERIRERERNLANWAYQNWPTEYAAYRLGHREGYQQGVLQAPDLDARTDE